ncbi:MAG: hypothetical protein ACSLFJ_13365, partial [Immundisolibacter sp.]
RRLEHWAWRAGPRSTQVKASRHGRLTGADSKPASAKQMEVAQLRAELARVKMERYIQGKATADFAKAAK